MCTIIGDRIIKARKKHKCMAMHWIHQYGLEDLMENEFTELENQELQILIDNNEQIQPGYLYRNYAIADNGTVTTIKESIIGSELCSKYDLYPDDSC